MEEKKQVDIGNALVVPRGDYSQTLEAIIAGGFCPFCEEHLFRHHHKLVHCYDHWLVTENSWPYEGSRFHFLFIARTHVEKTEDLSSEAWAQLHELYRQLVKKERLEGATLFIRSGNMRITGASVNHLHAHLVVGSPRTEGAKPMTALIGFKQ